MSTESTLSHSIPLTGDATPHDDSAPSSRGRAASTATPAIAEQRVLEVDYGRGLAVLVLAIIHTLWMYANGETQENSILGHVVHFIGKGTPAFLLCMGISMSFSRKQNFSSIFKRGIYILGLAYLMNFLKFIVPISVFNTMPEEFIAAYGWQSPLSFGQLKYLLLTGDILQMAGVALLLLAFIKKFANNKWAILTIAVAITLVSRETAGLRIGGENLKYLNELFFSGGYHVYFPVIPWMSYILFGMFIGEYLNDETASRSRIFTYMLYSGFICLGVGGALCFADFEYHFGNFFNLGPGGVIYLLGINLVLLWLIHKIVSKNMFKRTHPFLLYLSQRVTSIYIIQWVIICWGMGVIGFRTLNSIETMGMMLVMLAATFGIQKIVDEIGVRIKTSKT